jgi:hypothetical protein
MRELLEPFLVLGFVGLLFLLRLDASRFGAAEYDDEELDGGWRGWIRRLAWYGLGITLVLVVYVVHPQPVNVLHLDLGPDRPQALLLGLIYGFVGILVAFAFAWIRYGRFRLPPARLYPGGLINSLGTAFIDETLFRGMILGLLLSWDVDPALAVSVQAALYALATRLGGPGRSRLMLLITIGIGVLGGWLVLETGGVGAALVGHAITRFALFLSTGHAGQARAAGWEPEEVAGWALPPSGWGYVGGGGAPPGPERERRGTRRRR